MKVSMKYAFLLASSLFFFTGCTVTPMVGVGVYGGYGYPSYGYGGRYYGGGFSGGGAGGSW